MLLTYLLTYLSKAHGTRWIDRLQKFDQSSNAVKEHYYTTVANITASIDNRFKNLVTSPIFKHMDSLLDTKSWPISGDIGSFGDIAIDEISTHFNEL